MTHQWFVARNGKEQGPFPGEQLKSFADAGKLHKDDMVRRDDMKSPAAVDSTVWLPLLIQSRVLRFRRQNQNPYWIRLSARRTNRSALAILPS